MPVPAKRLPTEIEQPLAAREKACRAQRETTDGLTRKLEELNKLIESDDSIPEPLDEEEDSLVYHVEVARPMPRDR